MTEKEIRDIVKDVIKSQIADIPSKAEVNKLAKNEAEKAAKKIFDDTLKKEIKDMIRQSFVSYNRFMWEKKGIWMNQI